jgi:hypothetical protein
MLRNLLTKDVQEADRIQIKKKNESQFLVFILLAFKYLIYNRYYKKYIRLKQ